ncbi:MAG: SpoIIIAH-like family protein [Tissierellaceae bacterium]|nr:SpoIIIAH-like family protein [Tissierellaceae bacterium]
MFKIKRPAIIGLLLILLVFTGYLNYQFTQQALRKTSQEYQKYELSEMQQNDIGSDFALDDEDDIQIVDSILENDGNIKEVISSSNETIKGEMDKEVANFDRNYFVEYRLSRDKLRANLIDRLSSIVNNDKTNDTMRTEAQSEIINIGKISETELQIEALIKSKGFDEAVVLLTDEDIKVVVSVDELTDTEMVKILDIVRSETDFDMDNIKIIKKQ